MTRAAAGTARPIEILLVEDSPADAYMTREVFREARLWTHLTVVEDGQEAVAYLRRSGEHEGAVRPDLILLDLNLPKRSGREVLSDIKQDPNLRAIPVVILTTSQDESDVVASYEGHANAYISKPIQVDAFMRTVAALHDFWFGAVRLPQREDGDGTSPAGRTDEEATGG